MDNVDEKTKLIFIVTYRKVSIIFWNKCTKKILVYVTYTLEIKTF